eukprot:1244962-Rhodomonas_salina.1
MYDTTGATSPRCVDAMPCRKKQLVLVGTEGLRSKAPGHAPRPPKKVNRQHRSCQCITVPGRHSHRHRCRAEGRPPVGNMITARRGQTVTRTQASKRGEGPGVDSGTRRYHVPGARGSATSVLWANDSDAVYLDSLVRAGVSRMGGSGTDVIKVLKTRIQEAAATKYWE